MDYFFVSVGGSYKTGSSAVIDLLREYPQTRVIEGEFKPFGGEFVRLVQDLAAGRSCDRQRLVALTKTVLGYGKKPTIANKIFSRVVRTVEPHLPELLRTSDTIKRSGRNAYFDTDGVFPDYREATNELFCELTALNDDVRVNGPIARETLTDALRRFFFRLLSPVENTDLTVVDQLIKPQMVGIAPFMPFARIVIVTRDPRDQFCDIVRRRNTKSRFRGADRARVFVEDYKKRYHSEDELLRENSDNVLRIRFEDLVYWYTETTERLERFLNLQPDPGRRQESFDPEIAIANTCLFRDHEDEHEIALIERGLASRLYPFPD